MTLDDAIVYYDEIADKCRKEASIERNDYMDLRDDASEARQLASWLNELKLLREKIDQQPDIIVCGDCKHWICHDRRCGYWNHGTSPMEWCCHGERRTDE